MHSDYCFQAYICYCDAVGPCAIYLYPLEKNSPKCFLAAAIWAPKICQVDFQAGRKLMLRVKACFRLKSYFLPEDPSAPPKLLVATSDQVRPAILRAKCRKPILMCPLASWLHCLVCAFAVGCHLPPFFVWADPQLGVLQDAIVAALPHGEHAGFLYVWMQIISNDPAFACIQHQLL